MVLDCLVQVVELETEEGNKKSTKRAKITGITPSGYLMAMDIGEDSDDGVEGSTRGAVYELHPDGNSLDFMKGSILGWSNT